MIIIDKVAEEHGCWGNMAPYPVIYNGLEWKTTEALFQALRFDDLEIRELIRAQKSPMSAKMLAKKHKASMVIEPMSVVDVENMRLCLKLKLEQHPKLQTLLKDSGSELIVENCSRRQRGSGLFWGAALRDDGEWIGENMLGQLWMELRDELSS